MNQEVKTDETFDLFHAMHVERSQFELIEFLDKKATYIITICGATLAYLLHEERAILFSGIASNSGRFAIAAACAVTAVK